MMMKKLGALPLLWITVFLSFQACSDKQDFDQFDDIQITPLVASSLFSVEVAEPFINTIPAVNAFYSETFNFDAFTERFVAESLLEGTISYEIENTTSKPVTLVIEFLDAGGNSLDAERFDIPAAPTALLTRDVAYGPGGKALDILINTTDLRITGVNLGDNTSTSTETDPKISLKSAAEFLVQVK